MLIFLLPNEGEYFSSFLNKYFNIKNILVTSTAKSACFDVTYIYGNKIYIFSIFLANNNPLLFL